MNRYLPPDVIRKLCAEVKYCCPVKDCGNQYLTLTILICLGTPKTIITQMGSLRYV